MQKIKPFLWFDGNAGEAAKFYTSIFTDASIDDISYYPEGAPMPKDTVMSVTFHLAGQEFIAINGGPMFQFTPAISFFVSCNDQAEIDHFWNALCEGGEPSQCGWLRDKFGLSWQIIPPILGKYLGDKNPKKAKSVVQAMLGMKKIEIAGLQKAYDEG